MFRRAGRGWRCLASLLPAPAAAGVSLEGLPASQARPPWASEGETSSGFFPLASHPLFPTSPPAAHGKSFWSLTSEKTIQTWGEFALNFCLEIRGNNLLAILAPNGYFLRGDREGTLVADGVELTGESLWEF